MSGAYAALADEYYDETLHPTCANLREGSLRLIRRWIGAGDTASWLPACDVGAGRSVICETLSASSMFEGSRRQVTVVDDSVEMLAYSDRWVSQGVTPVVCTAGGLPFSAGTFRGAVCSLGDSYNDATLWPELRRILLPHGLVAFTTPSYQWASAYRSAQHDPMDAAVFTLRSGRVVDVPSIIAPEDTQVELMRGHGFVVLEVGTVYAEALTGTLSPKVAGFDGPVVTGYLLRRA